MNYKNAGRKSKFGEEAEQVAISVPKRLKKESLAICNNAVAKYVKNMRQIALEELWEALTSEQAEQLTKNIGYEGCCLTELLDVIKNLLEKETLIFDGEKSLFFKKTGLKAWEAFR